MPSVEQIRAWRKQQGRKKRAHKKSCRDKIAYGNRKEAQAAAIRTGLDKDGVTPYACENCKKWHLGNKTPRVLRILDRIKGG